MDVIWSYAIGEAFRQMDTAAIVGLNEIAIAFQCEEDMQSGDNQVTLLYSILLRWARLQEHSILR